MEQLSIILRGLRVCCLQSVEVVASPPHAACAVQASVYGSVLEEVGFCPSWSISEVVLELVGVEWGVGSAGGTG